MKKIKLLMMIFCMALFSNSFAQAPVEGEVDEEEPADCQPGGLANTGCPYWNIKYSTEVSIVGPKTVIICETGGQFKCKE